MSERMTVEQFETLAMPVLRKAIITMERMTERDGLDMRHGQSWSAGTPRTDEEAAVMLGATEPRHALRERLASRRAAVEGCVVLEPSPRVTPGEPMPAATMPVAEWREAWRDAEAPVLTTLRERCEASGARVVLPLHGFDPHPSYVDRYARAVLWGPAATGIDATLDELYWLEAGRVRGGDHVPADAERVYPGDPTNARANPLPWAPRDWCEGLAGGPAFDAQRDEDPAATWQAMRAAAPERVYPEPSQT